MICKKDGDTQKPGRTAAQLGDGRGDETDNDQRHAEGNKLAEDIFDGYNNHHQILRQDQAGDNADDDAQHQTCGKALEYLHGRPLFTAVPSSSE